jgi:DNA polymerase-3 subunit alpha
MIDFSLNIQSSYSFNGSIIDIDTIVKEAKEMGYLSLGLTDRLKIHGLIKFYKSCVNHGIKPLLGMEIVIRSEKYSDILCLVYAKNDQGYQSLMKLSSFLSIHEDHIDLHQFNEFNQGLILVPVIDRGDLLQFQDASYLDILKELLVDMEKHVQDFFLGFSSLDLDEELYKALIKDWNLILVNPVKYIDPTDVEASDVLKRILRNEYDKSGFFDDHHGLEHLLSQDELRDFEQKYTDLMKHTYQMIGSIDVRLHFNQLYLPKYPSQGMSSIRKLKTLTEKGLKRRLIQKGKYKSDYDLYHRRLEHEMAIIENMHYEDYFLIVWDFVLYAKKQGILVGPGRGSAAGSLISYVLGITEVDPLEFNLYFERFLNPERITMPDIDMDFPDDKRDQVIRYVVDKYGMDKVSSIITFGTFQGKSAIRDVGRILDTSSTIIDDLTKKISDSDNSIEQFEKDHPKDYQYYMNNQEINQLMRIAKKISGLVRHVSTHAAGIIISDQPIQKYTAIQPGLLDMYQTQYEASDLESIGLLKIDFLGIRNLTIIQKIIDLVKKNQGKSINVYKLPLDDPKTFKLLQDVKTLGIFQLESEGMMNLMRQMKLDQFEDIATCISLHRPGPMENIPAYIRRRNKEEMVDYLDKALIPILKPTHGIIVYQEQIMKIANQFAGYSLGEADVLRRAVSKKIKSVLVKERKKFVDKVRKQGYTTTLGNKLYDYIVKFANYGFNKSHAVAYSYVAYWMAYFKANYPSYFLAVLLDFQIGSVSGTKKYIREAKSMGIDVLPPKINHSGVHYLYEDKGLRYPFMAIKGIGEVMASKIVEVQKDGVSGFVDFYQKGKDLPKNVIETLIYANAFSEFGVNKKTLIENLDRVEAFISFHYKDEDFQYVDYDEFSFDFMAMKEKELLGVHFEYHLMHSYHDYIRRNRYYVLTDILEKPLGRYKFVGMISKIKTITTKKQDEMAFVSLEDEFSQADGVLFPRQYQSFKDKIETDKVYIIQGKTELRHDLVQIIIDQINEVKL